MPFVKLDCGILNSTLWIDRAARELFITALLMAEPRELQEEMPQIAVGSLEFTGWSVPVGWYGFVEAAGPGIVHRAGLDDRGPVYAAAMDALARLGEPEPASRSHAFDGRRLVRVDGGFIVLNFIQYREKDSTTAERSKRWRERQKAKQKAKQTTRVTDTATRVIRHQAEAEAEAEVRIGVIPSPVLNSNNKLMREAVVRARIPSVLEGALPREHRDHVFCDDTFTICVPSAVHAKFLRPIMKTCNGEREQAHELLLAWYSDTAKAQPVSFVMGDAFRFWQPQFDAKFASPQAGPQQRSQFSTTVEEDAAAVRKHLGITS